MSSVAPEINQDLARIYKESQLQGFNLLSLRSLEVISYISKSLCVILFCGPQKYIFPHRNLLIIVNPWNMILSEVSFDKIL